jgi:hypothetical protein
MTRENQTESQGVPTHLLEAPYGRAPSADNT